MGLEVGRATARAACIVCSLNLTQMYEQPRYRAAGRRADLSRAAFSFTPHVRAAAGCYAVLPSYCGAVRLNTGCQAYFIMSGQRSGGRSGGKAYTSHNYRWVVPRLVHMKRPQNVRFSITRTRGSVRLEYRNGTVLRNMETTRGRVPAASARSGGRALKQESVPGFSSGDVSVVRARG